MVDENFHWMQIICVWNRKAKNHACKNKQVLTNFDRNASQSSSVIDSYTHVPIFFKEKCTIMCLSKLLAEMRCCADAMFLEFKISKKQKFMKNNWKIPMQLHAILVDFKNHLRLLIKVTIDD